MKLIGAANDQFVFQLGFREKELLLQVLKLYPCIPPAAHQITKSGQLPDRAENQRLLQESLAEHRAQNQRYLQTLLSQPHRLAATQSGWHLNLSAGELEWVLQVLNDIRVGSWLRLGSPESKVTPLTEENAPHYWAMELAGNFQMRFLEAASGKK